MGHGDLIIRKNRGTDREFQRGRASVNAPLAWKVSGEGRCSASPESACRFALFLGIVIRHCVFHEHAHGARLLPSGLVHGVYDWKGCTFGNARRVARGLSRLFCDCVCLWPESHTINRKVCQDDRSDEVKIKTGGYGKRHETGDGHHKAFQGR